MGADLSVVLPVRDGAATLREAIDSVLTQADGLLELIVVDDASSDASGAIAAAHPDPRVRVIAGRGVGESGARNDGIAAARGRLIGFVDHDDLWAAGAPDPRRRLLAGGAPLAAGLVQLEVDGQLDGAPGPLSTFASLLVTRELALAHPIDEAIERGQDVEWFLRFADAGIEIPRVEAVVSLYRRPVRGVSDLSRNGLLAGLHATIRRRAAAAGGEPAPGAQR